MRTRRKLRTAVAVFLAGRLLITLSCGDLVSTSVRDGIFNYISGSVGLNTAALSGFVAELLTGIDASELQTTERAIN